MTRRRVLLVLGFAVAFVLIAMTISKSAQLVSDPEDLRAFYCGGAVVRAHQDPYIAGPIRACEDREIRAAGALPLPGLALPAPLPGYAFVPFELLSFIPFAAASNLYLLLLVIVMAVTAILITKMTGYPLAATIAALILSDGLITILNGQIFPLAMLALCASAFELTRGAYARASAYAVLAAIEPHLALPAILSLAWSLPRARVPVALSLAALAAVALAVLGLGENLEYLLRVLPAHARSEMGAGGGQYSLTSVLFKLGVPAGRASLIGNVQYAAMCVLGVYAASRVARRYGAPELYVLVPPAFALLGGSFIHITQMAFAVPALFALAHRIPQRRTAFGIALLLVAQPWQSLVENDTLMVAVAILIVSTTVAFAVWRPNFRLALGLVAAMLVLGLGERELRVAYPPPVTDPKPGIAAVAEPDRLAEATWQAFTEATQVGDPGRNLAARAPTWIAIALLVCATTLAARRTEPLAAA